MHTFRFFVLSILAIGCKSTLDPLKENPFGDEQVDCDTEATDEADTRDEEYLEIYRWTVYAEATVFKEHEDYGYVDRICNCHAVFDIELHSSDPSYGETYMLADYSSTPVLFCDYSRSQFIKMDGLAFRYKTDEQYAWVSLKVYDDLSSEEYNPEGSLDSNTEGFVTVDTANEHFYAYFGYEDEDMHYIGIDSKINCSELCTTHSTQVDIWSKNE